MSHAVTCTFCNQCVNLSGLRPHPQHSIVLKSVRIRPTLPFLHVPAAVRRSMCPVLATCALGGKRWDRTKRKNLCYDQACAAHTVQTGSDGPAAARNGIRLRLFRSSGYRHKATFQHVSVEWKPEYSYSERLERVPRSGFLCCSHRKGTAWTTPGGLASSEGQPR